MTKMDPKKKAEMGRRVALKEITTRQACIEYGCKDNVVWAARRKWLAENGPREPELPMDAAPVKTDRPERPPVDHARLDALEDENAALHDEVRTLQKIIMTLGRAL